MDVRERKRDGGIDPPKWWPAAVADAKRDQELTNDQIAAAMAKVLGVDSLDGSRVSRCLSGYTATIPLMDAASVVLGIPTPVIVAESRDEAMAASAAIQLERRRAKLLARADGKIGQIAEDAENSQLVRGARYGLRMAKEVDRLVVAWGIVGATLARLDRKRMVRLLEVAQEVAAAHGGKVGPLVTYSADLEVSADAC